MGAGAVELVVLGGPTASGKSALALTLAERMRASGHPAEILCADSITVYRGFTIGAAKPSAEERARVPHHLLDLAAAEENFTAGDFVRHAAPLVERLLATGVTPIVAGGTGFYLRALLRGMASGEEDAERAAAVKARLTVRAEREGWEALHSEVLRLDPGSATTVHANDHYRILRALQAMELTGKPWSEQNREARATPPRFPHRYFRLRTDRAALEERIRSRSERMIAEGLVEEVRGLLDAGVPASAKPMQSVGYRETIEFLRGDFPAAELADRISRSTLKLAKQQRTWFQGEELAEWLDEPYLENLWRALGIG